LGKASAIKIPPTTATPSADHEETTPLRRTLSTSILATLLLAPLAGCGHQVTPDRIYGSQPGTTAVQFSVEGQLDFVNINYLIVLNTCGVGGEPYPNGFSTTYKNYSYTFAVGPAYNNSTVLPNLFEYYISGGVLRPFPVLLGSSSTTFIPDVTGDGTTFQIQFTQHQLDNPLNITNSQGQTPCVQVGGTDTATTWYVNYFTLDNNLNVLDSLGLNGPTDTTYTLPIDIATTVQKQVVRPPGYQHASNPNAWITGGQIISFPLQ
jgi:hypothetical protein